MVMRFYQTKVFSVFITSYIFIKADSVPSSAIDDQENHKIVNVVDLKNAVMSPALLNFDGKLKK